MRRKYPERDITIDEAIEYRQALEQLQADGFQSQASLGHEAGQHLQERYDFGYSWVNDIYDTYVRRFRREPWTGLFPSIMAVQAAVTSLIEAYQAEVPTIAPETVEAVEDRAAVAA